MYDQFIPDSMKIYSSEKALEKIDEIKETLSKTNSIVIIYIYNDRQKRDFILEAFKRMYGGGSK